MKTQTKGKQGKIFFFYLLQTDYPSIMRFGLDWVRRAGVEVYRRVVGVYWRDVGVDWRVIGVVVVVVDSWSSLPDAEALHRKRK